jgi:hypothetical protein
LEIGSAEAAALGEAVLPDGLAQQLETYRKCYLQLY